MSIVVDVIAKPTIILMCAGLLSLLLRRFSASLRHAVWILALAGAVVIPLAALLVPQLEWSALPDASTSVTFLPVESAAQPVVAAWDEGGLKPSTTYPT